MRLILQALPTTPAPAPLHGHKVDLDGPARVLIYCVCVCCACVSECTIKQSHTLWHLNLNSRTCAVSKYEASAYYKNYLLKNRLHQRATGRGRVTHCPLFPVLAPTRPAAHNWAWTTERTNRPPVERANGNRRRRFGRISARRRSRPLSIFTFSIILLNWLRFWGNIS